MASNSQRCVIQWMLSRSSGVYGKNPLGSQGSVWKWTYSKVLLSSPAQSRSTLSKTNRAEKNGNHLRLYRKQLCLNGCFFFTLCVSWSLFRGFTSLFNGKFNHAQELFINLHWFIVEVTILNPPLFPVVHLKIFEFNLKSLNNFSINYIVVDLVHKWDSQIQSWTGNTTAKQRKCDFTQNIHLIWQ